MFNPPSTDRLKEVDDSNSPYHDDLMEIEGVISPSSQGGWPHDNDYDVHCFEFCAWRRPGKSLVHRELTILRPVDPDADYFSDFPTLSIQRFSVLLCTDETRAVFAEKSLREPERSGLVEVATELAKPIRLNTDRFGELTLDRSINLFEGNATWNGQPIKISFDTDESFDIAKGLAAAELLWNEEQAWKQRVEDFSADQLLGLKNEVWLDDDESDLTADQFKSRMTLKSIHIDFYGGFTFWHDDGDLFWGHSIQISGCHMKGLTSADIPG